MIEVYGTIVRLPCNDDCDQPSKWIEAIYCKGYADSMAGPGEPDMWCITDDSLDAHTHYSRDMEDFDTFQNICNRVAESSFDSYIIWWYS